MTVVRTCCMTVIRTYLYWIGIMLGMWYVPLNVLFTAISDAPVMVPYGIAGVCSVFVLLSIARPTTWGNHVVGQWILRCCGISLASLAFTVLSGVETVPRTVDGQVVYIVMWLGFYSVLTTAIILLNSRITGFIHSHPRMAALVTSRPWKCIGGGFRAYLYWIGIFWGCFIVPTGIAASHASDVLEAVVIVYVFPLAGILTGIILIGVDGPSKWAENSWWQWAAKCVATLIATALIYPLLGSDAMMLRAFMIVAWVLYVFVALGGAMRPRQT